MSRIKIKSLNKWEYLCLISVILIGLFFRWYQLDFRPIHHDEALNSIYGKYIFDNPEFGFYRYNPLLHGPLLYHLEPLIYSFFGVSISTIRGFMAVMGTLMMFIPFLFTRFLNNKTIVLLIAMIALSPTHIYWSRFVRHDFLVILELLAILYGVVLAAPKLKTYFVVIPLCLHLATKENFFVHVSIMAGFIIFEQIFICIFKLPLNSMFVQLKQYLKNNPLHVLFSFLIGAFLFCYLYSGGFNYSQGVLDGLYRKSFLYWIQQHEMERIKGPFSFQFIFLSWYELPFITLFSYHFFTFYLKRGYKGAIVLFFILAIAFGNYLLMNYFPVSSVPLWRLLKLKIPLDVFLVILLFFHTIGMTSFHLIQKKQALSFWAYLFGSLFFTYSYLGERVPWLSLYCYLAGLIYFSLYYQNGLSEWKKVKLTKVMLCLSILIFGTYTIFQIQDPSKDHYLPLALSLTAIMITFIFRKKLSFIFIYWYQTLFLIVLSYSLYQSYLTNIKYAGRAREFIGQVHTTHEAHQLALKISKKLKNENSWVLTNGTDVIWPFTWYFHGNNHFRFNTRTRPYHQFDFIIDSNLNNMLKQVSKTHKVDSFAFRGWWVPHYQTMTLKRFLTYAFFHRPWNQVGHLRASYAEKKLY